MNPALFGTARFLTWLSEIAVMSQLASPFPSFYLSVRSISKNGGRGFINFGPGELYKSSWNIQFRFQSNKIRDSSLEYLNGL